MSKKQSNDIVVSIRFTKQQHDQLTAVSKAAGMGFSSFVRALITRHLDFQKGYFGGHPTPGLDALSPQQRYLSVKHVDSGLSALMEHGASVEQAFNVLLPSDDELLLMVAGAIDSGNEEFKKELEQYMADIANEKLNRTLLAPPA